jgi:SAM-dependent methyltransferase
MNRLEELCRFVQAGELGMEIGPYFNPVVPKADGYRVLVMDVVDAVALREKATADPHIPNEAVGRIEDVDIVCNACDLGEALKEHGLEGRLGYIVSSHNFEHLADPIRFLQSCSRALKPGGHLTMAIPDFRACFDHFRSPTRLADWLSSYRQTLRQPSPEMRFDYVTNCHLSMLPLQSEKVVKLPGSELQERAFLTPLQEAYERCFSMQDADRPYEDAHCSVLFAELFDVLLHDLRQLGLVNLEPVRPSRTVGHEFFVHLAKPHQPTPRPSEQGFQLERERLLLRMKAAAWSPHGSGRAGQGVLAALRTALRLVVGDDRVIALREWNRSRRRRLKERRSGEVQR